MFYTEKQNPSRIAIYRSSDSELVFCARSTREAHQWINRAEADVLRERTFRKETRKINVANGIKRKKVLDAIKAECDKQLMFDF